MPLQLRTLLPETMHPIKPIFPNGKPNPKLKQNFSLLFPTLHILFNKPMPSPHTPHNYHNFPDVVHDKKKKECKYVKRQLNKQ